MSRLDYLTIAIVALCIAALIYLVYRYVNLPHSAANTTTTEVVDTDNTQFQSDNTTGFPAEDTSDKAKPGPGAVVEPEVVPEEKTPVPSKNEKPVVTEPKPVAPAVNNNSSETASLSVGRYMVIGGSFEQVSHAQKQLRKIQKAGYPNARVEKFNRGAYASILVERFEQSSDAKALVKTLKSKGFDAMVLVKQ
ncbi:SPOR domain-containing protein [Haliscomenobacter sp.]|uniref:SPOR domain-containing protein n=1 Tax=Haliscomenobacter sp. TaxID=2717303 RepID=UPI003592F7AE